MQFSVWPGCQQPWNDLLEVATHAERAGFDRVYVADHFMSNDADANGVMLECWAVMAALAASVPRVGLATLVCGNTYRHPAVLVNQAATTDIVSGGRLVLGLGAGWQENEHDKYGIPLFGLRERMDRFEEACQIVRSLTTEDRTTFDGTYYRITDAPMNPKPTGPMPLLVGGGGEKRTLRIAARYAQEWNVWSDPETFAHKSAVLDAHCAAEGRDPGSIHRSTQALVFLSEDGGYLAKMREANMPRALIGTPAEVVDTLGAYRDAGVDEFIVPDFTLGSGARRLETLDLFAEQVAVHLR